MAKQLVNPFERHVEKIILAISATVLVGVLVKFVFSSPNKIELGGVPTTPGTIDSRLAQRANEILQRLRDVKAPEIDYDPKLEEFVALIEPIKAVPLPEAASSGVAVPLVDDPDVTGRAKLVSIPAPPAPKFVHGRNTLLSTTSQGETRTPVDWVMLAVPVDVKGLMELQRRTWGATKMDVVFAPLEVQRREVSAGATASESDWKTIASWPAYKMPPLPTIRLFDQGGKITANKDDQRAAEKYELDLSDPRIQLEILRPLPPPFTKDENPWKFPVLTTYEAVVKQDQEFISPNEPHAAVVDRYGLGGKTAEAGKPKPEAKTVTQELNQKLDEARVLLEQGRKLRDSNEAMRGYNSASEVFSHKDASPDLKSKAQKLMKEAEIVLEDIRRARPGQPAAGQPAAVAAKRERVSPQDMWAYDAAPDSITNGGTYQYRARICVLNRLAGFPESFEDPTHAQQIVVCGEWSEPTEPIHIADDSWFFVTRDDKSKREIYVEFIQWYDGVWVKPRGAAKFYEGDTLTYQDRIQVPGMDKRDEAVTTTVDFGENLTLLDIEFARPLRERKSGTTAGMMAVKFAQQPAAATAAVFVDDKGQLQERIVSVDRENPQKRKIETWVPAKRASLP